MRQFSFLTILIIISLEIYAQPQGNRFYYKYNLSQATLTGAGYELRLRTGATPVAGDPIYQLPAGRSRPASITYDKGAILVDFWSIVDNLDTGLPGNMIHRNAPFGTYDIRPDASHTRTTLHDPTWAISLPFSGWAVGLSSIPFRYRPAITVDNIVSLRPTVTSPRPDVAVTGGFLWGRSTFSKRGVTHWPKVLGVFFGVTSADIRNGVVKSTSDLYGSTKTQVNPAITYGGQFTFGRNNFGLIIGLGFETSFGKYAKDWAYQSQPFIGLGIVANAGIF